MGAETKPKLNGWDISCGREQTEGKESLTTTLAPGRSWEGAGALALTLQVHFCHQKPRGDLAATPPLQEKTGQGLDPVTLCHRARSPTPNPRCIWACRCLFPDPRFLVSETRAIQFCVDSDKDMDVKGGGSVDGKLGKCVWILDPQGC